MDGKMSGISSNNSSLCREHVTWQDKNLQFAKPVYIQDLCISKTGCGKIIIIVLTARYPQLKAD